MPRINRRQREGVTVTLYYNGRIEDHHRMVHARVHDHGTLVYETDELGLPMQIAPESPRAVGELLVFLANMGCLDGFTPEQRAWGEAHEDMLIQWAEDLGALD